MKKSLLVLTALIVPAFMAVAEQPGSPKSDSVSASAKTLPMKGAKSANPCAVYGNGFVRVEGSDTCVKVGGATSLGVGTAAGAR